MRKSSLALLLLAGLAGLASAAPPQDMLASRAAQLDARDHRIAELEAEVARLRQELARLRSEAPGEWRVYEANPAWEVYGQDVKGEFVYIARRKRAINPR